MKPWAAALVLCSAAAYAQTDATWLEFHFVRQGMPVPDYTFRLYEDHGTGTYKAENATAPSANKYSMTTAIGAGETVQHLDLTSQLNIRIFDLVKQSQRLTHCDAHRKGIADTGAKTLSFHQADRPNEDATCHYNYSEDKAIAELTNLFQGMAVTLDMGRKMERDHKYDRLALDGDMSTLAEEVKDGRALGLSNIRATLESLTQDEAVLERVRMQAGKLAAFAMDEK